MKNTLFQQLSDNHQSGRYPFHMPGHKRRLSSPGNLYEMDITEIDGFDSLYHAQGILKDISRRAANFYHAEETFLLVNGSTVGLLCAISACTSYGGDILIARNCHKAVYHAAYIRGLHVQYVYPRMFSSWGFNGSILPDDIERILKNSKECACLPQAVVITSPTYEGVVSDVRSIAKICHHFHVPLIVDEAHGAHFGCHPSLPSSAVTQGADLVIQSLHKTMPALTQTALLHVNGNMVDRKRVQRFFSVYQTSSPSYLLMGSIDQCLTIMEQEGENLSDHYMKRLTSCRNRLNQCKNIRLFSADLQEKREGCYDWDRGRLIFSVRECRSISEKTVSGNWLMERLRTDFNLEMEMAGPDYVVAITSIMDSAEGFERLCEAIESIDASLETYSETQRDLVRDQARKDVLYSEPVMRISDAVDGSQETVLSENAIGRINADFISVYPPGIPVVVPGEIIRQEHLVQILQAVRQGLSVEGVSDPSLKTLQVVSE